MCARSGSFRPRQRTDFLARADRLGVARRHVASGQRFAGAERASCKESPGLRVIVSRIDSDARRAPEARGSGRAVCRSRRSRLESSHKARHVDLVSLISP